jgi:hypothetical protein
MNVLGIVIYMLVLSALAAGAALIAALGWTIWLGIASLLRPPYRGAHRC